MLSAVIMVIAVQHLDAWSLRLVGRFRNAPVALRINTAFDLLVVVAVAALSIAINIVVAVFIGVAIAVISVRIPHEPKRGAAKLLLRRYHSRKVASAHPRRRSSKPAPAVR